MASGGLVQLRAANAYVGWTKQTAWHADLAPTNYWKWRKGTTHDTKPKIQAYREGDTGRWENLAAKISQYHQFKVVEAARARTLGCGLEAFLGLGSDAFTAATQSTTLSSAIVAGATTFSVAASIGTTGTAYFYFTPGVASATFETANVNLASRTGTGPFTYTLQSGTFRNAHASGDTVINGSTHVLTPQTLAYDPYAVEVGRGDGVNAPFQVFRYYDSVAYDWMLTSEKGGTPVLIDHSWYAGHAKLIGVNAVPVYEGSGQIGLAGAPFTHANAQGSWNLNGVTTGNMLTVERCVVKGKNTTSPEEWVTENVQPDNMTMDDQDITVELTVIFQTFTDYLNTFFGGVGTAGTLDSALVVYAAPFSVTWTHADSLDSLALSVPYARYMTHNLPMDEQNKPIRANILVTAQRQAPSAAAVATFTLINSQNTAY